MKTDPGPRPMLRHLTAVTPRDLARWCFYLVALLAPGSFVVFIVLWINKAMRRSIP